MLISNKKGVELTLQTIVVLIIMIIVLIVIVIFFTGNFSDNTNFLFNIGRDTISEAS